MILDRELAALCRQLYGRALPGDVPFDHVEDGGILGITWGVVQRGDTTILCFRGSITPVDWIRDALALVPPLSLDPLGPVHPGFIRRLPDALEAAGPYLRSRVVLTGHSLGAARAAIAAGILTLEGKIPVVGKVTFGEPKPGFRKLASILSKIPARNYRNGSEDKHEHDVITNLPFTFGLEQYVHSAPLTDVYSKPIDNDPWATFRFHHIELYEQALRGIEDGIE